MFDYRRAKTMFVRYIFAALMIWIMPVTANAKHRAVTAADCVRINYITEFAVSSSGRRIAYLVNHPDAQLGTNVKQLYIKRIPSPSDRIMDPIMSGAQISHISWLHDDHLLALMKDGSTTSIVAIEVSTGRHSVVASSAQDIFDFSMDASGTTLIFSTSSKHPNSVETTKRTPEDLASGYEVSFEHQEQRIPNERLLYVVHAKTDEMWEPPEAAIFGRSIYKTVDEHIQRSRPIEHVT